MSSTLLFIHNSSKVFLHIVRSLDRLDPLCDLLDMQMLCIPMLASHLKVENFSFESIYLDQSADEMNYCVEKLDSQEIRLSRLEMILLRS